MENNQDIEAEKEKKAEQDKKNIEIEKLTSDTKSLLVSAHHIVNPKTLENSSEVQKAKEMENLDGKTKFKVDTNAQDIEKDPYHTDDAKSPEDKVNSGDDKPKENASNENANQAPIGNNDAGEKARNDRVKYSADEAMMSIDSITSKIEANIAQIRNLGGDVKDLEYIHQKILQMRSKVEQEKEKQGREVYSKQEPEEKREDKNEQKSDDNSLKPQRDAAAKVLSKVETENAALKSKEDAKHPDGSAKYSMEDIESRRAFVAEIDSRAQHQLTTSERLNPYLSDFSVNPPAELPPKEKEKEKEDEKELPKEEENKLGAEKGLSKADEAMLMTWELQALNKEFTELMQKGDLKDPKFDELSQKMDKLKDNLNAYALEMANSNINSDKAGKVEKDLSQAIAQKPKEEKVQEGGQKEKSADKSAQANRLAELSGIGSGSRMNVNTASYGKEQAREMESAQIAKMPDMNNMGEPQKTALKEDKEILKSEQGMAVKQETIAKEAPAENKEASDAKASDKEQIMALRDGVNPKLEEGPMRIKHDFNKGREGQEGQENQGNQTATIVQMHQAKNMKQAG